MVNLERAVASQDKLLQFAGASEGSEAEVVRLLLAHGALTLARVRGMTPLDILASLAMREWPCVLAVRARRRPRCPGPFVHPTCSARNAGAAHSHVTRSLVAGLVLGCCACLPACLLQLIGCSCCSQATPSWAQPCTSTVN